MLSLHIHQKLLTPEHIAALQSICPFGAFVMEEGRLTITAACRMCRLCAKQGPAGAVEFLDEEENTLRKEDWQGIAVYAEQQEGALSHVVFELLGKARELAAVVGQPVVALLLGHRIGHLTESLLASGADTVYVYDREELRHFRVLPYAAAFEDFVRRVRPGSVLVGATNLGRTLAPRVAARFGTGLTADCTRLAMKENTDLVQIRPAFGGNIMAQIVTPKHRPQFCTVRYKVFSAPHPVAAKGRVSLMSIPSKRLQCATTVLDFRPKAKELDISEAEKLVAVGRGIRGEGDLRLARAFAGALGAQLACTRPLVERGWMGPKQQIGLSGRTVAPKLLVTLGISGAVQFTAGIRGAETVVAINQDSTASIFDVAHHGLVGDLCEILPRLLRHIANHRMEGC